MKKYVTNCFLLIFTFLLFSCSNDNLVYITDNDYLNKNNIHDVVHIISTRGVMGSTTDEIILHGVRNNQFWFASFEKDTKKLVSEWSCAMLDFEYNGYNGNNGYSDSPAYKLNNGCYVLNWLYSGSRIYLLGENNQAKQIYNHKHRNDLCFANEEVIVLRYHHDEYTILNIDGNVLLESASIEYKYYNKYNLSPNAEVLFSKLQEDSLIICDLKLSDKNTICTIFKDKFNRNVQFDHGYGEIENVYINSVIIMDSYAFKKGGLCHISSSTWDEPFTDTRFRKIYEYNAKGIKEKFKLTYADLNHDNLFVDWYNGSVLVLEKYVVNDNCQVLYEFKRECNTEYSNVFLHPISYTHVLEIDKERYAWVPNTLRRFDYENNSYVWRCKIDKLDGFINNTTRYKYKLLSQEGQSFKIHVKAVNYDGSKLEFDFLVDKATGKITYL